MLRKRNYTTNNAYRTIERLERKAQNRAREIAEFMVRQIHIRAPYDDRTSTDTTGPHLRDAYYVRQDPQTGDLLIKCRRRYWAFVEFGTKEHGGAQPHVRPAIEATRARFR